MQSHVIVVDGAVVGAAVLLDVGYRFVATDIRMHDLDGSTWPALADVKRLAGQLYRTGRFGLPPQPTAALSPAGGRSTIPFTTRCSQSPMRVLFRSPISFPHDAAPHVQIPSCRARMG